jgi:hypothetical protein
MRKLSLLLSFFGGGMKVKYRPGNDWKHLSGPVYEHISGTRMHMMGFVKLPTGEYFSDSQWPNLLGAARMIRINGGNRKRGLMAWAINLLNASCEY